MKAMRVLGEVKRYTRKYIGRLDNLQAAVLNVKMKYYENDLQRGQEVAKKCTEQLKSHIAISLVCENRTSVWAQYTVRVKERNVLQEKFKQAGIPTAVHYPIPIPMHLQECFSYLGHKKGDDPISERCANEVMSLPMNPFLFEDEINYITSELKAIL